MQQLEVEESCSRRRTQTAGGGGELRR